MSINELDINNISRLISQQVDLVTCILCCKYYIVPTSASCGHILCHGCWLGIKTCISCGASVDSKGLKFNLRLQNQTEHTHTLVEEFEKVFNVKLDEYLLYNSVARESSVDPIKHVKDWLASSENQFSAPQASQQSCPDVNSHPSGVASRIEIHCKTTKTTPIKDTVHVPILQDDWDKIEEMPNPEDICKNNKENAVGPMDIEPFVVDQFDFTTENPRRSARKKQDNKIPFSDLTCIDKSSTKVTTCETGTKTYNKENWANVKRIKKEFSKLNKKNNTKLNVSIEMCKKTLKSYDKNAPTVNTTERLDFHVENQPVSTIIENNESNDVSKNFRSKIALHKSLVGEAHPIPTNQDIKDADQNKHFSKNDKPNLIDPFENNNNSVAPVSFIMKGALRSTTVKKRAAIYDNNNPQSVTVNTDNETKKNEDIEITIKVGNTLAKICIKKNDKDIQLKINTDKEMQTSPAKCVLNSKKNASCSPIKEINCDNNVVINVQNNEHETPQLMAKCSVTDRNISIAKTLCTKKNTESADTVTATAPFEITESIEKELSKEMEKAHTLKTQNFSKSDEKIVASKPVTGNNMLDEDCILNDFDLFDSDSVKEGNVQLLKYSNHAPSEILTFTIKNNNKRNIDKRARDTNSSDFPVTKKMKIFEEGNNENERITNISNQSKQRKLKNFHQDSESPNYDIIMGQVFASIDADMKDPEMQTDDVKKSQLEKHNNNLKEDKIPKPLDSKATPDLCDSIHVLSENVFSILAKDKNSQQENSYNQSQFLQQHLSGISRPILTHHDTSIDNVQIEEDLNTPVQNKDDSDESIVEETPQKSASLLKVKQKNNTNLRTETTSKNDSRTLKGTELDDAENKSINTPNILSVIDLSEVTEETIRKSKQVTVLEAAKPRPTLETPLTITKFVDQIKHKSTPVARKSLNFDKQYTENSVADPEQTLCASSFVVANTTQEREFMSKAFEDSPNSGAKNLLTTRNPNLTKLKYCLAGSCLTPLEISNVKLLCALRNWTFVDKYTSDLTHLVVAVDEERKSQRSVKYMCTLAAGKWIVSYEWVEKCLHLKRVVDEEPFEALDGTGEPGPRRSRVAKQKLFQGITFFCMPPFSVPDVDTLKAMIAAAGGRVVDDPQAARVTGRDPALLLAEPEHTQEDRFIYLAVKLSIVPVNREWVLNCLGSYTISSVQELLLCPASLLPPATAHWPQALMAKEDE